MNGKSNGVQSTFPYKYSQSYFFSLLLIFYGSISKPLKMQPGIYTLVHLEWLYVRGKPSPPFDKRTSTQLVGIRARMKEPTYVRAYAWLNG